MRRRDGRNPASGNAPAIHRKRRSPFHRSASLRVFFMRIDLRFLETGKVIRDPIWGHIHVPRFLVPLVDAEEFQRLRDISQLGHVLLVYPGARHSRFEHSLGVFHIAGQFLRQLVQADPPLGHHDRRRPSPPGSQPATRRRPLPVLPCPRRNADVFRRPRRTGPPDHSGPRYRGKQRPCAVGDGPSSGSQRDRLSQQETWPSRTETCAWRNILSGTLDPDKIDYLLRDARYCGVPFGESVNRDRLLGSITCDRDGQRPAITYKGVSAVEALIFTSYLMYRNVYWHLRRQGGQRNVQTWRPGSAAPPRFQSG